ncbi:4-hydroxythreonine-4-phosphate dehydrogenase PdxA [Piscibacillus salipiscarius]|uniref:4-hydroxythreonine-4-phosphate dehydrogenase PdxA n=1 Tax=Piscibacillus salipiscarius TaxID=299480 RepID=A0ABW5QAN6_9BACI
MEAGLNIIVGLLTIRISIDYRTVCDIAGKGITDEKSLIEAIRQGVELAPKN